MPLTYPCPGWKNNDIPQQGLFTCLPGHEAGNPPSLPGMKARKTVAALPNSMGNKEATYKAGAGTAPREASHASLFPLPTMRHFPSPSWLGDGQAGLPLPPCAPAAHPPPSLGMEDMPARQRPRLGGENPTILMLLTYLTRARDG